MSINKLKRTKEMYKGYSLWFFKNPVSGRVEVWYKNTMLANNKTKAESFENAKERIDYQLFRMRFK